MEESQIGLKVTVNESFAEAVAHVTAALKDQGFGVLTTIDVQQTLKAKLDKDFRKYTILGACNPNLAHRALSTDLEVGLLLPCNVVVYEVSPTSSVVAAVAPMTMLGVLGENPVLSEVAREADARLRTALARLDTAKTQAAT